MDIEKYTERSRGFIQSAQSLALREGHQRFTPEHLLKVLLDDEEGLAAGLIMGGINSATNIADTRTWTSLPKEFQYARLATPASRELTIDAGGVQKTVALAPGSVNVVYVKSASPTAPLLVSSFVLK